MWVGVNDVLTFFGLHDMCILLFGNITFDDMTNRTRTRLLDFSASLLAGGAAGFPQPLPKGEGAVYKLSHAF